MPLFISMLVAMGMILLSYLPNGAESQLASLRIWFVFFSFIAGMVLTIVREDLRLAKSRLTQSDDSSLKSARKRCFQGRAICDVLVFLEKNPRYGDVAGDALNFVAYEAQIETDQDVTDSMEIVRTILDQSLAEVDNRLLTDESDDDEDCGQCAHKK